MSPLQIACWTATFALATICGCAGSAQENHRGDGGFGANISHEPTAMAGVGNLLGGPGGATETGPTTLPLGGAAGNSQGGTLENGVGGTTGFWSTPLVAGASGSSNAGAASTGNPGPPSSDAGQAQQPLCVFLKITKTNCAHGGIDATQQWVCEPTLCTQLVPPDISATSRCTTTVDYTQMNSLTGACSTYLPNGAVAPVNVPGLQIAPVPSEPTVQLIPNAELLATCEKAVARQQECADNPVNAACDHFSQLEGPQAMAAYDCYAANACGETDACTVASTRGGTEICANLNRVGCLYDPGTCEEYNASIGWLRSDVAEAVHACFARTTCLEMMDCINQWRTAIWGS